MNRNMRIIFIGNYVHDRQESMIRFANLLCNGFQEAGYDAEIWWPKVILGKPFKVTVHGFAKWIGYIDKWILFPFILRRRQKRKHLQGLNVRYHVCDQSNSPYLPYLPANKTGITCHDVLAIRGGLGYKDAYIVASPFGKILQKTILKNLLKARLLACNSRTTFDQLLDLAQKNKVQSKDWRVIHLSYNGDYKPMPTEEAWSLISEKGIKKDTPFILHVGNSLTRKNRIFLLDVLSTLGNKWNGFVCYAGKVNDETLIQRARSLQVEDRMILLERPSNTLLQALYSVCFAFTYPSLSEGFPWPVIEAQACGAPVITSNIEPMPEISGTGALHADPLQADRFADSFTLILNPDFRKALIAKGFENVAKFAPPKMIDEYLAFHNLERIKSE